ncbi:hypothetical protein COU36_05175 [Candidatus Micrarchaeota archaeon CG10_big_fil_rev_8_21_14_0_10_59_7]|nr:MAG: hypothetical protein COU36_05175 [Candidatus Micrarchaeota archaeon CG10_big_fil_rev_8_21_14_0_10_59_7]
MRLALVLLLASSLLAVAAETEPERYHEVTLSSAWPSSDDLFDAYKTVRVHVGGREFLVNVVDVSENSASFEIYEGTAKICGQYDPNCIVKLGEENQALATETGFYITLNDKPGTLFKQVRVSFKIPGSACERIMGDSDETKALNVVFVPDGFAKTDGGLFRSSAENAAEALLSVEPFKSNAARFNFYVADFALGKRFDFKRYWWDPAVDDTVRSCRRTITVAFSKYYFLGEAQGALAHADNSGFSAVSQRGRIRIPSELFWDEEVGIDPFKGLGEQTITHEFGHAFARLADEYFFESSFAEYAATGKNWYYDYGRLSNIGEIGCTGWCSGEAGGSDECRMWWSRLAACEGSGGYDCLNQVKGEKSNVIDFVLSCDFGKGCEEGTGCYAGAGYEYMSLFKPVPEEECIMSGGKSFCPVCTAVLEQKLREYG